MEGEGTNVTTRHVLLDYMRFRLNEAGYCGSALNPFRDLFVGLPVDETPAMNEVHCVGCQMESHPYHSAFLDMADQQFDLLGNCARANYVRVLNQIFCDRQINWGRLIMVMVYTGRLAVKAMKCCCPDQVRNLVEWCETFFRDNFLDQWIEANGGWDKIKGVYATDWQRKEIVEEMGSLTAGLAIMGGLVATAFFILQRPV